MTKVMLTYPSLEDDLEILNSYNGGVDLHRRAIEQLTPVTSPEQMLQCRAQARSVLVEPPVVKYVAEIIRATRTHPHVQLGSSPRGAIQLLLLSKVFAVMDGRDFVTPDDVKLAAPSVLRHRVLLTPEAQVGARTADQIVNEVLSGTEVPR
jgi:MoxR-like ATPase